MQWHTVHSDISFTLDEPVNGILPFLDLSITVVNRKFTHTLYTKRCHSDCVIPWTSHHPIHMKLNVLRNELRRAERNGSNEAEKRKGMDLITNRYRRNGYPLQVIRHSRKSLLRSLRRTDYRKTDNKRKVYVTLPFCDDNPSERNQEAYQETQSFRACFHLF